MLFTGPLFSCLYTYVLDEIGNWKATHAALEILFNAFLMKSVSSMKLFTSTHLMTLLSESLTWECGIWPEELLNTCTCWWTGWELLFSCMKCYRPKSRKTTKLCVLKRWTLRIRRQFHWILFHRKTETASINP